MVGNGVRADAVLGRGFAVITAVAPTSGQRTLIEQRHAVLHYAEPGSALADWLHRGRATAAIVRPDQTVMAAGADLTALCAVLPEFG